MTVEQVIALCRPAPAKGKLRVYQTDNGFIRVMVETREPKWFATGFAVFPSAKKTLVRRLYAEACTQHARGYHGAIDQ